MKRQSPLFPARRLPLVILLALIATMATAAAPRADESDGGRSRSAITQWSKPGNHVLAPYLTSFLPIPELPTEDVDAVEVLSIDPIHPNTMVWPVEGRVHFFDLGPPGPPTLYASFPTVSPNISGVDFVSNGRFGVFQTLGYGYIYKMLGPGLSATIALPGAVPSRRDIDPMIISDPVSVSGYSALFFSGTGVHCREIPTGVVRWDLALPTPMVEAVDPAFSNQKLWVPSEGFVTVIDPIAGVVLSSTFLRTPLVREVDLRFVPTVPPVAYFPVTGAIWRFDDTAISGGGIGAPLGAPIPIPSPLIEGNDLEIEPTNTYGFLPTLANMVQVNLAGGFIAALHPFTGFAHQRNQDAVFTPLGVPARAVYCVQGAMFIYDVFALTSFSIPSPGVLVDGVDPAFSDTPPFGRIVSVATSASTNIVNAVAGAVVGFVPHPPGFGALRTDLDHRPGPMPGNYIVQPMVGGLFSVTGFLPNDWVVASSAGIEVVDLAAAASVTFLPYATLTGGLSYRGGDIQPTTLLGPPEPAFSVDDPDQDFVTKCWEYKFATQRWPYWYSLTLPALYPAYVPYGVFGPPAYTGYDLLNHIKLCMLDGDRVAILNEQGNLVNVIALPASPQGGMVWDYDNKVCKIHVKGQLEVVIDLKPLALNIANPPVVSFVPIGNKSLWYPVVDRRNGWEFLIYRGGKRIWIFDHIAFGPPRILDLPSRVIRRPVFDDQRKTLCLALSNGRLAFLDAHKFRLGLPTALYFSPVLPAPVIDVPVFDFYNHMVVCQLRGSRLVAVSEQNGALLWDSGLLPYWPTSPLHIDCYNKKVKAFYRNAANSYELYVDLYPLVFGAAPAVQWFLLPGTPYGYPGFDSKDGYEFIRIGANIIQYRSLVNPLVSVDLPTPFPMRGALFLDRVNKYGLVSLQGNRLFYLNLYKVTNALPGATAVINLPAPVEDDIVFTHTHHAIVHLSTGAVAVIDLLTGSYVPYPVLVGLPLLRRQLYVHPFRGLVNYPWYVAGVGGEVTIDMAPTRWNPPAQPTVTVANTPTPPLDAFDFTSPPGVVAVGIQQLNQNVLDLAGIRHGSVSLLEPGTTLMIQNVTKQNTPDFMAPYEGTADDDGVTDYTVVADPGDVLCFTAIDPAGNVAPTMCVNTTTVDAPDGPVVTQFMLSLLSENPVRDEAALRFALPEAGRVELGIYDVSGRLVESLISGEREAGEHDATWRLTTRGGGRAEAGVYFARIRTAAHEANVRLVVMP